jgi:hypothetical protein
MLNIIAGVFSDPTPAAPPNSYESIATVSLTGSQSTISFSSIPSTFKHLQIRAIAKAAPTANDASYDLRMALNSDTTAGNYKSHNLYADGSSVGVGVNGVNRQIGGSAGSGNSNIFTANVYDILDYANTNKNKTVRCLFGTDFNGSGLMLFASMLWMNTSAITSISIDFNTGQSFGQYTSFALYGIKG